MKTQDALKVMGMAECKDYPDKYAKLNFNGVLGWWKKEDGSYIEALTFWQINNLSFIPYHEVKEIRPEKAGELWQHEDESIGMIIRYSESSPLGISFDNGQQKFLSDTNLATGKDKPYREYIIHNKNGWKRLYPPVEDENVERIEIERVAWRHSHGVYFPTADTDIEFSELKEKGRMKMILVIPKDKP